MQGPAAAHSSIGAPRHETGLRVCTDPVNTHPTLFGKRSQRTQGCRRRPHRSPRILAQSAEAGIHEDEWKTATYENRTNSAKYRGLEKDRPRERVSGLKRLAAVRRFFHASP